MAVEQGYPITLIHPQHKAATITTDPNPRTGDLGSRGSPELFPSVTVNGADDEAKYRAQGYLRYGEAQKVVDHYEYPKMMRHPDYEEEVPAQTEARIENNRIVGTFVIPAKPAKMPDMMATNEDQENALRELGYKPAGEYNKEALDSVLDGTIYEEEYDPEEYPKWVDEECKFCKGTGKIKEEECKGCKGSGTQSVLIQRDPRLPDLSPDPQYPKYENGVIIPDPRFDPVPDPNLYPMWVHKDGIPSEGSVLVKNPKEEFEARQRLNPPEPDPEPEEIEAELPLPIPTKVRAKSASASV